MGLQLDYRLGCYWLSHKLLLWLRRFFGGVENSKYTAGGQPTSVDDLRNMMLLLLGSIVKRAYNSGIIQVVYMIIFNVMY